MDEQRQLLFANQFLPSNEQKLIDSLREAATRRITRPPEVTAALRDVPIDTIVDVVVGPNYIGVLFTDGRIGRFPYVATPSSLAPSDSRAPATSAPSSSVATTGAAPGGAVGGASSGSGSGAGGPGGPGGGGGSALLSRSAKFRRYERAMLAAAAGGRPVIVERARPMLPASSVPEDLIAQAQVVLEGRSREVIIRELQRTNLNVNQAVNNLLTRDDDDDVGSEGPGDFPIPEELLTLMDGPLGLEQAMYPPDSFEFLLSHRERRSKSDKKKEKKQTKPVIESSSDTEALRRYEIPPGSISEPWEGIDNKLAARGNALRFTHIACTQSELLAISTDQKLYGWKWTESAGDVNPHAMYEKMRLAEGEVLTHLTACTLRVAVMTSSGRISTWLDTVACGERLSEALFVPPQKLSANEVVEQLVVSNQIAVARCPNNVFYWCGLYPVNDRRRIFEKTRSQQRKHVTFDTKQIVEGSEVRTKSAPIYSIGCIAANLSSPTPMIGILMEDAWALSEVCRFRLLDPAAYDTDRYDPAAVAAATETEAEAREAAVAQQALSSGNRKRPATSEIFDADRKQREEPWPISDVIFIHEEVQNDTAIVKIVDGGYCAVEYMEAGVSPTDAFATPASKALASKGDKEQPKKMRLIRKDELTVVSHKMRYARSPNSMKIEPYRFVLAGSTATKRVISAVADSLGIRALVERRGGASIVRISVCGKTLTSHALPLHAASLHAQTQGMEGGGGRATTPTLINYGDDSILLLRDAHGGILPLVRDAAAGFREPSYLQLPASSITAMGVKAVKDKDRPSWAPKANREAVILSLQGTNGRTLERRLPSLLYTVMCCDDKAVRALLDALQNEEDLDLSKREIVDARVDGNRNVLHAAVMNAFATKNGLEADVESGVFTAAMDSTQQATDASSANNEVAPFSFPDMPVKLELDENACAPLLVQPSPVENPKQRQENAIAIVKMLVTHPICMPFLSDLLAGRDIHGQTPFMAAVNHRAYSAGRYIFDAIQSLFVEGDSGKFSSELLPFIFPVGSRPDDSPLFILCYNDTCSFTWTGDEHINQDIYECRTCGLTGSLCCCTECAYTCHRNHDIRLKRTSPTAYCDCWEKKCCKSLVNGNQRARQILLDGLIGKSNLYKMLNGRGEHILLYLARKMARQASEQRNYTRRPRRAQAPSSAPDTLTPEHDLDPPTFASSALMCLRNWSVIKSLAMIGVRQMDTSVPMAEDLFHLNAQHGSSHLDKFMLLLLTKCSDESIHLPGALLRVLTKAHNRARESGENLEEVNFVISRFVRSVARLFIIAVVISKVAANMAVSGAVPAKETGEDLPILRPTVHGMKLSYGKDTSKDSKLKNMGMFIVRCKSFFEHFAVFTLHEMAQLADASLAPVRTGILRPCVSLAAILGSHADSIENLEKYINSEHGVTKSMSKGAEEREGAQRKRSSRREGGAAAAAGAAGGGAAAGGGNVLQDSSDSSSDSDSDGDGPSSRRHASHSSGLAANEEVNANEETNRSAQDQLGFSFDDDEEVESESEEEGRDEDENEEEDEVMEAIEEDDAEMDYDVTSEGDQAAAGEEGGGGEEREEEEESSSTLSSPEYSSLSEGDEQQRARLGLRRRPAAVAADAADAAAAAEGGAPQGDEADMDQGEQPEREDAHDEEDEDVDMSEVGREDEVVEVGEANEDAVGEEQREGSARTRPEDSHRPVPIVAASSAAATANGDADASRDSEDRLGFELAFRGGSSVTRGGLQYYSRGARLARGLSSRRDATADASRDTTRNERGGDHRGAMAGWIHHRPHLPPSFRRLGESDRRAGRGGGTAGQQFEQQFDEAVRRSNGSSNKEKKAEGTAPKEEETPTTLKAAIQLSTAFSFAVRVIGELLPVVAAGSTHAADGVASLRDDEQLNEMEEAVRRRAIDHVGTRLEDSWRWLAVVLDRAEAQIKYANAVSSTEEARKKESKEKKKGSSQRRKSPHGDSSAVSSSTTAPSSQSSSASAQSVSRVKRETISCLLGVLRAHSGEAGDDTPLVDLETLRAPALVVDAYLGFVEAKADAEKLFEQSKKKETAPSDRPSGSPDSLENGGEEEIVGVRRFYQRSNSVSYPGVSLTDEHDTLQLPCQQSLPIVERPQLLTSTVEKEVIFGPPPSTKERTKEEHDKMIRSYGVSHPHNQSLTAAPVPSHQLFVVEEEKMDTDHAVLPIQPVVIPSVASAPAKMDEMVEEKKPKKETKGKRGRKRSNKGETKKESVVVTSEAEKQQALKPAGFDKVTYEEILETFKIFREHPLRKLMGRWRFALQLIAKELHAGITDTLGGDLSGSRLLQEMAGFEMKQHELRARMEKYRATAKNDLAIEVHRDPSALVRETCYQLNRTFTRRYAMKATEIRSGEPLPLMASRNVKVKFTDEPGEGTGVARSYYTALAEALASLKQLPFSDYGYTEGNDEFLYGPTPTGSSTPAAASSRGANSSAARGMQLSTTMSAGRSRRVPSPLNHQLPPYTPADMAAAEALNVSPDFLLDLQRDEMYARREPAEKLPTDLTDRLFIVIRAMYPNAAARLTGMFMDLPLSQIILVLRDNIVLKTYLAEAIDMLMTIADPSDISMLLGEDEKMELVPGPLTSTEADDAPLFFRPSKKAHYSPVPGRMSPARMNAFRNVGRMIGLCLMQCEMFPLRLSRHVLKYILGRPLNWHDFAFYDPQMFESLRKLIVDGCSSPDHAQFFDDLQMTFSIHMPPEASGLPAATMDLIPGGSEVLVTKENVVEYVYRFVEARLLGTTNGRCLAAIRQGVHDVIPQATLDNLTAEDLRLVLCGTETVSLSLMQSYTSWSDESHAVPESIAKFKQWFWQVADRLTPAEKQDLIFFWTGAPSLPSTEEGFQPLPTIVIRPSDDGFLPTANTCISRLYLPLYNSKKTLAAKLQLAIKAKNFGFV